MATYYVRKTGNNGSNGTSAGTAWLTLGKALAAGSTVAAGDTVYVGAGTYRETVTIAVSGSAGNTIKIIGDVDGSQTGDPGEVVWSNFTTNDTTAAVNTANMSLGTHSYIDFSWLTFVNGASGSNTAGNAAGGVYITWTDCTFNSVASPGSKPLSFVSSSTGLALGITIERCLIVSPSDAITFSLATTASGAADWDALCVIKNCLIVTSNTGISVTASGTAAHSGGGVRVYDCTIIGSNGMSAGTALHLSTTTPCEIHNSLISSRLVALNAGTSGQLLEDHNVICAATTRTNVSAGTGSTANANAALVDIGQSIKIGGKLRQFMSPIVGSPLLAFGEGSTAVTVDNTSRPRPSGGASVSKAAGYLELHDYAVRDTVTYNDAPASGKLTGPGDQYIEIPVDAVATTLGISLYFAGYGGTNYPSATLLANPEIGVTAQTVTCSSSASSWQALAFTQQTPTAAGWVTIQVQSFDTNGTGTVNFDTITAV